MNHHGEQIFHVLILGRRKDEDSADTKCCVTVGDPWTAKQQHWESEAKEDHQLLNLTEIQVHPSFYGFTCYLQE